MLTSSAVNIGNFFEIGLSGWLVSLIALLIGGGAVAFFVRRRKISQSDISAGGDVAGGDIVRTKQRQAPHKPGIDSSKSSQSRISAGGDVAGGDIKKPD